MYKTLSTSHWQPMVKETIVIYLKVSNVYNSYVSVNLLTLLAVVALNLGIITQYADNRKCDSSGLNNFTYFTFFQ